MRVIIQRVKRASVTVDGKIVGSIEKGLLILLGVHQNDTTAQADALSTKCANLRIFSDANDKMNLSLAEVGGDVLVVSQFTLFGDCTKGNRPSFIEAAQPEKGRELYEYFVGRMKLLATKVETGIFGAMMDVELVNDGPVTLILDK